MRQLANQIPRKMLTFKMTSLAERLDIAAHLRGISMASGESESSRTEWTRKYDAEKSQYVWINNKTQVEYTEDPFSFASPHVVPPDLRNRWIQVYDEREKRVLWVSPSLGKEQWVDPALTVVSAEVQ